MGKAGLTGKGPVSKDLATFCKRLSRSTRRPPAWRIENGYEKAMLLQFEDKEPLNTLKKIGFAN